MLFSDANKKNKNKLEHRTFISFLVLALCYHVIYFFLLLSLTTCDNRLTCRTYDVSDHKVSCLFRYVLLVYLNTDDVFFLDFLDYIFQVLLVHHSRVLVPGYQRLQLN